MAEIRRLAGGVSGPRGTVRRQSDAGWRGTGAL